MAADLKTLAIISPTGVIARCFWVSAALCAGPVAVFAQTLTDPTRPPAEISSSGVVQAVTQKDSGLQTIIISPTRRAAIINGRTVELGAKLGDARLVGISESVAVLERAQGRQVLALFPGVEINRKQPSNSKDMKRATQQKKRVKKPASQTGKKGEK